MKPSVGRIVHFTDAHDKNVKAALITYCVPRKEGDEQHSDKELDYVVEVHIFERHGAWRDVTDAPFSEEAKAGHWSWPQKDGGVTSKENPARTDDAPAKQ